MATQDIDTIDSIHKMHQLFWSQLDFTAILIEFSSVRKNCKAREREKTIFETMHSKLHIFVIFLIKQTLSKQIFDAEIMKHAVKSKWFNVNPDDLDIAVYESQKIHGKLINFKIDH